MITRRGKSYGVRVYDPELKRKRWVGTFATLREARKAERYAAQARLTGRPEDCRSFAERWVDDYPRGCGGNEAHVHVRAATVRGGLSMASRWRDVDRPRAREWVFRQPQSNVRVVRSMFTDAINDGLSSRIESRLRTCAWSSHVGARISIALTEPQLHELADCALRGAWSFGRAFRAMILFAAYVGSATWRAVCT